MKRKQNDISQGILINFKTFVNHSNYDYTYQWFNNTYSYWKWNVCRHYLEVVSTFDEHIFITYSFLDWTIILRWKKERLFGVFTVFYGIRVSWTKTCHLFQMYHTPPYPILIKNTTIVTLNINCIQIYIKFQRYHNFSSKLT